jgi:hypothetical protein
MSRRLLAAAVAAVSFWAAPAAHAAPAKTTVHVVTTVGPQSLPTTFVTAAWSVDKDKSDRLAMSGFNPAGCATTVTATWQGIRRGARNGHLLDVALDYSSTQVPTGASTDLKIEYRLGGAWHEVENAGFIYGALGVGPESGGFEISYSTRAVAGRTVPVRLTVELTYPYATVSIADTFRVLPQK